MVLASSLAGIILVLFNGIPLYAASLYNTVFPEPLNKEEEERCFKILQKRQNCLVGPSSEVINNEIQNVRTKLIEHNLRLVAHVAKEFSLPQQNKEDCLNIGYVGLIKAVDTFDIERGTKFATYAIRCIRNEILMDLRKRAKLGAEVSIETPIVLDNAGSEQRIVDVICCEDESVLDQIVKRMLINNIHDNLKRLSELEQRVLDIRFGFTAGLECTQQETAVILSISRSYVSRIEKKAIQKLKKLVLGASINSKSAGHDKFNFRFSHNIVNG